VQNKSSGKNKNTYDIILGRSLGLAFQTVDYILNPGSAPPPLPTGGPPPLEKEPPPVPTPIPEPVIPITSVRPSPVSHTTTGGKKFKGDTFKPLPPGREV
jgi:hypothetical protein